MVAPCVIGLTAAEAAELGDQARSLGMMDDDIHSPLYSLQAVDDIDTNSASRHASFALDDEDLL